MKKPEFKIGDLVTFKGKGFGLGRINSIAPQRGTEDSYLYHVLLLTEDMLVGVSGKYIEKIEGEDRELINSLDSIGNL